MIKSVEDMTIFKEAYQLSLKVHKLSLNFPKYEQYSLADQLRRSSKSIVANLCEGFAKQVYSKAEFRRYVQVSIGSCDETKMWLMYSKDLEYINSEQYAYLRSSYDVLVKQFVALYFNIK